MPLMIMVSLELQLSSLDLFICIMRVVRARPLSSREAGLCRVLYLEGKLWAGIFEIEKFHGCMVWSSLTSLCLCLLMCIMEANIGQTW